MKGNMEVSYETNPNPVLADRLRMRTLFSFACRLEKDLGSRFAQRKPTTTNILQKTDTHFVKPKHVS